MRSTSELIKQTAYQIGLEAVKRYAVQKNARPGVDPNRAETNNDVTEDRRNDEAEKIKSATV